MIVGEYLIKFNQVNRSGRAYKKEDFHVSDKVDINEVQVFTALDPNDPSLPLDNIVGIAGLEVDEYGVKCVSFRRIDVPMARHIASYVHKMNPFPVGYGRIENFYEVVKENGMTRQNMCHYVKDYILIAIEIGVPR